MYIYIICFILLLSNIIIFTYFFKKRKKDQKEREKSEAEIQSKFMQEQQATVDRLLEEQFQKMKSSMENNLELAHKLKVEQLEKDFSHTSQVILLQKEKIEAELSSEQKLLEQIKEDEKKIVEEYKKTLYAQLENDLNEKEQMEFDRTVKNIEAYMDQAAYRKEMANKEIEEIKSQLEEFRSKRNALNETIRIENEMKNEVDSHRIILSDADRNDIEFLVSIENKINNKEILHKLIWTEYLQKPFNQMLKNVFGSSVPKNVIYCIENIKTNKKYIGKTVGDVSKRWTEHIKTSLSIGTIKKNNIHEALFGNWDDFCFSIIEVVSDSKLSEREKYYISFFESDKYGYNEKGGG